MGAIVADEKVKSRPGGTGFQPVPSFQITRRSLPIGKIDLSRIENLYHTMELIT
jgi:hypothetical protein